MKIRNGFVSNSSSSSFVILNKVPTGDIGYRRLSKEMTVNVLKHCIKEAEEYLEYGSYKEEAIANIEKLKQHIENPPAAWLTHFISDSGEYTDPFECNGHEYYSYCSGAHCGPYDPSGFVCLSHVRDSIDPSQEYEAVWIRRDDYVYDPPKKGQMTFEFVDDVELEDI